MTVPSEINKSGPYLGNGSTTVFGYGFRIVSENHIRVIKTSATGDETDLTITTDYTVSGVGNSGGGSITVLTAPASGEKITLVRSVPFVQETDLENQGAYYAETVEDTFDLGVMRDQQLKEAVDRAVKVPASYTVEDLGNLVADIIRLADSADSIDTVSDNIGDVNIVADNISDVNVVAHNIAAVIAASGSVLSLSERTTFSATVLAARLTDGKFGFIGSELYEKKASAVGSLSCTNDLGVDGLIPAHGRATPWHFGGDATDPLFDSTAAVQAAFDWARLGWNAAGNFWERHVDLDNARWLTTYPINATGVRQPRFKYGNGEIYGKFTGIGAVLETYGTNAPHIFGILTTGAPEERTACPFYGYARGRQDTAPLAVSSAPIAPSHAGHIETYGCFQRAALLNLGSEVSRTKGHLQNRAIQATSCVVASFGDQKHAVKRWGVPVTSVFTDLPSVADGAFSNILHDYSGVEMKASAFWNATITGITNGTTAVVSFTAANSFQMNRIVEGDIIYLTGVAGMTQINATKFEIRSLVKTGLTGTFNLHHNGAPVNSSAYGTFTGSAYMWRASGDCFVGGSVRGVNIGGEAYLLTFGGDPIVIYADGGDANEIKFSGQTENSCKQIVRFITETGSYTPVVGMELDLMSASQVMERVIVTEGDGTVALADFRLSVKTHAGSFKLVEGGPATVSFSRAHLSAPVDIVLTGADSFTGHVEKFGAGGETNRFIGGVESDQVKFSTGSAALAGAGARVTTANGGQIVVRSSTWAAERPVQTIQSATSAQLLDATSAVNTLGKMAGAQVLDTTLGYVVYANTGVATGTWRNIATGAITHTPV